MSAVPRWGHYDQLRPRELAAIQGQAPIAYVPWGAIEWHSLHAPLGLDSHKASGICAALAAATGGLVLPAIPLGAATIKSLIGFRHSLEFSDETVGRVAEEICTQLAEEGFQVIVVLTGHYPEAHTLTLRQGAERAARRHPQVRFAVWPDSELLAAEFACDHAGATETSFQMLFAPHSVDVTTQPDRALTLETDGITGEDPRQASAERGARQLACVVREGSRRVRALLAQPAAP